MQERQIDTTTRAIEGRSQGQRMKRGERRDMKRAFLKCYASNPSASAACRTLRIARATLYRWCAQDNLFFGKYQALTCAHFDPRWLYMSKDDRRYYLRQRHYGQRLYRYYTGRDFATDEPHYRTSGL